MSAIRRTIGALMIGTLTAVAGFPVYKADLGINWEGAIVLVSALILFNVVMSAIEEKK